jgi:hypothetical protein
MNSLDLAQRKVRLSGRSIGNYARRRTIFKRVASKDDSPQHAWQREHSGTFAPTGAAGRHRQAASRGSELPAE